MNRRITAVSKDFYNRRMGELVKQFPNVFNKSLPMPLAIGVHKVLAEQTDFTRKEINALLSVWTRRHEYVCAAVTHGFRVDLNGEFVEEISEEHLYGFSRAFDNLTKKQKAGFTRRWNRADTADQFVCEPFECYVEAKVEEPVQTEEVCQECLI